MFTIPAWISVTARFALYAAIFLFFALTQARSNDLLTGICGGVIMADLITWFGRAIIKIRHYLREFAWDALINIAVVTVFALYWDIPFPSEGEGMAAGFMTFLVVSPIKTVWYMLQEMAERDG